MQILFSADWHIKLGQRNVPRDWQTNRYRMLFDKLNSLEPEADIHIIGGDIFDTLPKPDELALFFEYVASCNIPTYIYDGNHEATKRGKTFLTCLRNAVYHINDYVHIIDSIETIISLGECVDCIPYTHLKKFNPKDFKNKICCTHVRGDIPPHVKAEIDLDLFKRWDVVLAGDLHAYSNSQKNIIYPGSPLSITFHREPIDNGVIIFDTDKRTHRFIPLCLPQLIRKTVNSSKEIKPTEYDHTIYEVTGNVLELSSIDTSSELVDKKIITNSNEAALNLANLTIDEELTQYLEEIIKLDPSQIDGVMNTFNDFYKRSDME